MKDENKNRINSAHYFQKAIDIEITALLGSIDVTQIYSLTMTQIFIANWLQELGSSVEVQSNNSIGFWVASAFTSLIFIFILLIRFFPKKSSANFEINKKKLWIIIILSSILTISRQLTDLKLY